MVDEIRVETPDDIATRLPLESARLTYKLEDQSLARVRTPQPLTAVDGGSVDLDASDDEVYIERSDTDIWGGILRDVSRQGTEIELVVDSFERAARDAEPSGASETVSASDQALVQDAIDDTPELERGRVALTTGELEFELHHASPALRMKLVREATGLQMRYHADKTVEYVRDLGGNKTGTTISPANQQLVDSVRVERDGGDLVANNLRVIGAGGAGVDVAVQTISVEREKWRRAYFRDTSDPETLRERGETLLEELRDPWIKVQATLSDPPGGSIDPVLGDAFHVLVPPKGVDANLEVVEVERRIGPAGDTFDVTLSNRSQSGGSQIEKLDQAARDTGGGRSSSVSDVSKVGEYSHDGVASTSAAYDLTTEGDYLYMSGYGGSNYELFISDISSPASPTDRGSVAFDGPSESMTVDTSNNVLYAAGDTDYINSFDISDPDNPIKLDSDGQYFDCSDIVKFGDYVYVVVGEQDFIVVYDVSDPNNLNYVNDLTFAGATHIAIDEETEQFYVGGGVMKVLDVSTKSAPVVLGSVQPSAELYRQFKEMAYSGNYLYNTEGEQGGTVNILEKVT
jgi:hypothetical protein